VPCRRACRAARRGGVLDGDEISLADQRWMLIHSAAASFGDGASARFATRLSRTCSAVAASAGRRFCRYCARPGRRRTTRPRPAGHRPCPGLAGSDRVRLPPTPNAAVLPACHEPGPT
jgi:hypothetical protein